MSAPDARWLAVLALVFNAFTWGVSWWPFRQFEAQGLHPLWLTSMTYAATVAVLVLAWPGAGRELLRSPSRGRASSTDHSGIR